MAHVLIAIEPVVLETALATLLRQQGLYDVSTFHDRPHPAAAIYDAAVVSPAVDPAPATVVIRLPDDLGNAGTGTVTVAGRTLEVDIRTHAEIIDLLDRHCAGRS